MEQERPNFLPKVKRGDPIRADEWNAIVDAVNNNRPNVSIVRTRRGKSAAAVKLVVVRLSSAWSQVGNGALYSATGKIGTFNEQGQWTQSGEQVTVYSISKPNGGTLNYYLAIFNDSDARYEIVSRPLQFIPRYVAGVATAVYTNANGDYQIDNVGTVNVKVAGDTSYTDTGTLYFSPTYFAWGSSSLDIVGKKEIKLKTKRIQVVTDVALSGGSLDVTKEWVTVVDE